MTERQAEALNLYLAQQSVGASHRDALATVRDRFGDAAVEEMEEVFA